MCSRCLGAGAAQSGAEVTAANCSKSACCAEPLLAPLSLPLSLQELVDAGRGDLHAAIARCGGTQKLAEHLQLPYTETRGRRGRQAREASSAGTGVGSSSGGGGRAAVRSRLRLPPGVLASEAVEAARARLPVAQTPKGPASRLLERELVLEAYQDTTFV